MEKESTSFWTEIKKFEDILAKDPHSYCFAPLSELYRKLGLLDDAISIAKRGIEEHPEYIGGFMAVGRALFEKGVMGEAKTALEKVAKATPENLMAQKILSQIYLAEGNMAAAERALLLLLTFNPEDTESRLSLEVLSRQSIVPEEKETCRNRAAGQFPCEQADFQFSDTPVAGETLERFAEEAPASHHDETQVQEFTCGELDETPEQKGPNEDNQAAPLATITLAQLFESQGYFGRALEIYQDIVNKEPNNQELKDRIQVLQCRLEEENAQSDSSYGEMVHLYPGTMSVDTKAENALTDEKADLRLKQERCPDDNLIETLEFFLDSVRRRKECRQEIL